MERSLDSVPSLEMTREGLVFWCNFLTFYSISANLRRSVDSRIILFRRRLPTMKRKRPLGEALYSDAEEPFDELSDEEVMADL